MKQVQKFFTVVLVLIVLTGILTACSSESTSSNTSSGEIWTDDGSSSGSTGNFATSDTIYPEVSEVVSSDGSSVSVQGEKMIYTANLEVETTDYESSVLALNQIVAGSGGYYESRNTSNYDTYRYANYTIRIPAEQYKDFLSQVGQACHVLTMYEEQQNVSEAYYDIEARLTTQQTKLERLQKLLAEADNMADIITIESAISETELTIEQLTGNLRDYDNRIAYSTVTITLREVYRLSNSETPATTFSQRITDAFANGCRGFVRFMESVAIFLVTAWIPIAVLLVVTVTILIVRRKKCASRTKDYTTESTDPKP